MCRLRQALQSQGGFEWKGMPTRLNDIPHSRQIRQYFYADVCQAVKSAVASGLPRLQVSTRHSAVLMSTDMGAFFPISVRIQCA